MTIHELRQSHSIAPDVVDLIGMIASAFGKPIEIRFDESLTVPATVKIARQRMPHHLILIHPGQTHVLSYLIAQKCGSIERLLRIAPDKRKVAVSMSDMIRSAIASLEPELERLPEHLRAKLARFWAEGLVMQASNLPIQVRIDEWLRRIVPSIRQEQHRYLERDIDITLKEVSEKTREMTAPSVFLCSNYMAYAYMRSAGELLGEDYTLPFSQHREIVSQGEELYKIMESAPDGFEGDVQFVDRWAGQLKIATWFAWNAFEDMPEAYFENV